MPDQNNKELTLVRVFDAPREMVWEAWTDPKLISQWWGPQNVTAPFDQMDVDARVGGNINIVMVAGKELGQMAGMKWPMTGKFTEVTKPEKLVYTATAIMNDKPVLLTHTTVTFEEEGGKTKMTVHILVTKTLIGSEGALAGMKMGWTQQVDKLAEFLVTS